MPKTNVLFVHDSPDGIISDLELMERMRRNEISGITDMTIFKLVFFGLYSEAVALHTNYPAKSEVFITKLLRRVEIIFSLFGKYLHFLPYFEVALEILDYRKVVQGGRLNAVKNVDFNQFTFLYFDINGMNAFSIHALTNADCG